MTKDEFVNICLKGKSSIYCLVGPNTTGKTYLLNKTFDSIEGKSLFIDEDGDVISKNLKRTSEFANNQFIYFDESQRGKDNQNFETECATKNSLKIRNYILNLKNKIPTKYKSLGSKKLLNILDYLLSYNLNNVDYIFFDEPENSLDDENLKNIKMIFDVLQDNSKHIIMVTHSPRLLELMSISIDDIYIKTGLFKEIRHIKKKDLLEKLKQYGEDVSKLNSFNQLPRQKRLFFENNNELSNLYLNTLLTSFEFYKTLFYSSVIIVEGQTELFITKYLSNNIPVTNNYFVANGKFRIGFLIDLFTMTANQVTCFIDSDIKDEGQASISAYLTNYIENKQTNNKKLKVISIPYDVERFLEINKVEIVRSIINGNPSESLVEKFYKEYKAYCAIYAIENKPEAYELAKKLFVNDEEYTFK